VALTSIRLDGLAGADGVVLNGISPTGIAANGAPISIATSGPPLAGAALVGSRWTGHLSDGRTLMLRIDAAAQGSSPNDDLWSYQVSALTGTTWWPVCRDAAGAPGFADSVHGTWNLAQGVPGGGAYHPTDSDFTLACRGSAVSKCIELGYKPWSGAGRPLAACTRAMRAEFCGDGRPFTVDGTLVNIYDIGGVLPDGVAWAVEAEWTADGAGCVSDRESTRFWQTVHQTPWCYLQTFTTRNSCGAGDFGEVITELPPRAGLVDLVAR